MKCPNCEEPVAAGDAFCENCGTQLGAAPAAAGPDTGTEESARTHLITPPGGDEEPVAEPAEPAVRPCAACGAVVDADGYCTECGVRAGNGRDHVVVTLSARVAGVTDKGRVHTRNEDAMALAVTADNTVLVVCDGVSNSTNSDIASQAAADAALAVLTSAPPPADGTPTARTARWVDALQRAAVAGDEAAADSTAGMDDNGNPASCTFVAAVLDGDLVVAGWVGDSRAYWLPDAAANAAAGTAAEAGTAADADTDTDDDAAAGTDTGAAAAVQLSIDDSWATEQIAIGVPREKAEADPKGHAITRWLGPDSPPVEARTTTATLTVPGWLMVCSDGLWNYCSPAADMAALVAAFADGDPATADPTRLSEALVTWANEQGGQDNITVTLARVDPAPSPSG
jgi:serine/threonine protein phosphatase PrpC